MSSPVGPILNAVNLADGLKTTFSWATSTGLVEPALVATGASVPTFDGPVAVRGQATTFAPRKINLAGYVQGLAGYTEAWQAGVNLFPTGPAVVLQVGSLALDVDLGVPVYDRLRAHNTAVDYRCDAEAVPATWRGLYTQQVGVAQSIPVIDDRLDHASWALSGNPVAVTMPGTAPTSAVAMISGLTASTTYYLRNVGLSGRVAFSTAAGVTSAYVTGIPVLAGANLIRLEDSTGALAAGTIKWGWYGACSRYLGASSGRFSEGPAIWSLMRTGPALATVSAINNSMTTFSDMAARIGMANGNYTYATATAGLVLEPAATNLITNTRANGGITTGWAASNSGIITAPGTTAGIKLDGAEQWYVLGTVAGGQAACFSYQTVTLAAATTYTISGFFFVPASATANGAIAVFTPGFAVLVGSLVITERNIWVYKSWSFTTTGGTSYLLGFGFLGDATPADYSALSFFQCEIGPIATSTIVNDSTSAVASRAADLCAVSLPHNYLQQARATSAAPWVVSGTAAALPAANNATVADGTLTGDTWTVSNVDNVLYQAVTPDCAPNAGPWTAAVALRVGATITALDLAIRDQAGSLLGSAQTITMADFPAATTRTYYVTVTAAQVGSASGLQVALRGKTGTGSVVIESMRLLRGSFPGLLTMTEGANVTRPAGGWEWPEWMTQNGTVQFKAVLPPISTGLTYLVMGDYAALCLLRSSTATTGQNYLHVRRINVSGVTDSGSIDVGAVWDGALHTYLIGWANYTLAGTQYMYLWLDVDGVRKYTSGNLVSASVTSWAAGERLMLSDGNACAALRDITLGMPAVNSTASPPSPPGTIIVLPAGGYNNVNSGTITAGVPYLWVHGLGRQYGPEPIFVVEATGQPVNEPFVFTSTTAITITTASNYGIGALRMIFQPVTP